MTHPQYYILEKSAWEQHRELAHETHYIDLPDGRIALFAVFHDWNHESHFRERSWAEPLPDVLHSQESLAPEHIDALKHIGVKPGHNMFMAAKKLAAIHPRMAFSAR